MQLADVLKDFFDTKVREIHTALPGEILEYDSTKQKAKVQPLIKRKYKDGVVESLPIIVGVPVIWPRSGNCSLTFPVQRGDRCLLVFSERSIDRWLADGQHREPNDPRRFDLSDGMAIMGLNAFNVSSLSENNTDLLLRFGDNKIRIQPDGTVTVENDSGAALNLKPNGKITLGAGGVEVLDILSQTLDTLSQATVGGTPLDQQGDFASLKSTIDSIKG